jgi:Asp-tRNA(Asn)/Glu-tRNA(Gln) amidotransferase A subunit family amidase
MDLIQLTATQAAAGIREAAFTSEELTQACLDRIAEREETVRAWAHLDPDYALKQARRCDEMRRSGMPIGSLHGVPVGVKDIFDTRDLPTEDGTALHAGRQPSQNAAAVVLLRQAGAVILGKTVTTELAVYHPGKTRNPRDPAHTPGGSSSGSAAAVADNMVPLALGTQTNGSVIRPASYCGVCGFKPTHGLISRHLVLQQSRLLDQVGVFARSIEDAALIADQLIQVDAHDPDTRPRARPGLRETAMEPPPVTPRLAFVKTPAWEQADQDVHAAFEELVEFLGENVEQVDLPEMANEAIAWHKTLFEADIANNFKHEYERGKDVLSSALRAIIERGQQALAIDYIHAAEGAPILYELLSAALEGYDAFITPASTGEAPKSLDTTGSPIFCTIWTLAGMPAISLPLLQGSRGLPIGVQLVGRRHNDGRLLRTARWLGEAVEDRGHE